MSEPGKRRALAIAILAAAVILVMSLGLLAVQEQEVLASTTWDVGDVFVGVSSGTYHVYDNNGVFKEAIDDGLGRGPFDSTTGCAFSPGLDKLYTTYFQQTKVKVFDVASPHNILQIIDTGITSPVGHCESVVFAADGSFYVGHARGNRLIHRYDPDGVLIATFAASFERLGTDWIDLASDQKTIFYTSEGRRILRYDTDAPLHTSPTQLPDFAALPATGQAFALRILPPGDGSRGLIVADRHNIKQLDGAGAVFATYDVSGEDAWFSLALDPDGVHFWAGGTLTSNFYKIPFESVPGDYLNTQVVTVNTGTPSVTLLGICVLGNPLARAPRTTACVDIKPGSDPNSINPRSRGVIPVAILGGSSCEVDNIDPASVRFGPDLATPAHKVGVHFDDVNDDGSMDAVFHFRTQDTGIEESDTEACISWTTFEGDEFVSCEDVRTVRHKDTAGAAELVRSGSQSRLKAPSD